MIHVIWGFTFFLKFTILNHYSQKSPLGAAKLAGLAVHPDFLSICQGMTSILKQTHAALRRMLSIYSITFYKAVSDINNGIIILNFPAVQRGVLLLIRLHFNCHRLTPSMDYISIGMPKV